MKYLYLIWRSATRKKMRSSLTLLCTIVAFILFAYLCAIRQALTGGVEMAELDRLIVRDKVSIIQLLPVTHKEKMERIPGVDFATHQTWFGGVYQDPKNFFMQCPVNPEEIFRMHPEITLPPDQMKAWLGTRTGAVVGRACALKYGFKIGDKVPINTPLWPQKDGSHTWTFDIVGIFDATHGGKADTTPLFFRYDYFDEARQYGKGTVGWYTIRVKNPRDAVSVARAIDAEFENSPNETKTEPEGAFAQAWVKQLGDITLIIAAIMGAVFFTLLLVTGNDMAQGVRERTGELAVLKALGFTDTQVLMMVLVESCLLALIGGVIGLGLAAMMISHGDPTGGLLPFFSLPHSDLYVGFGFAVLLGIVSGIFPALQAMRLRVADALRRI